MRGWILRAAALFVGLAMGVLVAELALRVLGLAYPHFYWSAPDTGANHLPGAAGRFTSEGESWVEINSFGMRDREHTLAKPPGHYRIALLGDSYSAAMQVDLHETFWWIAQEALRNCEALGGREPELLNFGVSGFGTAQELVSLRTRALRFDPDLVMLLFVPNDVHNNDRELEGDPMRPYFVLRDGELELDDAFLREPEYLALQAPWRRIKRDIEGHVRVLQLLREFRRSRVRRQRIDRGDDLKANNVVVPPRDEDWERAWNVTDALLLEVARESRAHGLPFLLVSATFEPLVHADPDARRAFMDRVGIEDPFYVEKRLAAVAERGDFDYLALAPHIERRAREGGECLHGFENAIPCGGHWNELGHRVAGERIAAAICGLVDGR